MNKYNYIAGPVVDGRVQDPKRLCRVLRAADVTGFYVVEYPDGTTGNWPAASLTKVPTPAAQSNEPLTIEPAS